VNPAFHRIEQAAVSAMVLFLRGAVLSGLTQPVAEPGEFGPQAGTRSETVHTVVLRVNGSQFPLSSFLPFLPFMEENP
jgi:hypothetical protein